MVGVALYPLGVFVVFQSIFMYLPTLYPRYAASLFAASELSGHQQGLPFKPGPEHCDGRRALIMPAPECGLLHATSPDL